MFLLRFVFKPIFFPGKVKNTNRKLIVGRSQPPPIMLLIIRFSAYFQSPIVGLSETVSAFWVAIQTHESRVFFR